MSSKPSGRELLAGVLQLNLEDVPEDAAIGQMERWDSLAHMHLLLALEAQMGVTLDTEELLSINSLEDIDRLLTRAG